jgi:hypothetical protein
MPEHRKLTWRKRLLFQSIVLVAVYTLMELTSLVGLQFSGGDLSRYRRAVAHSDPVSPGGPVEHPMIIHPYIGMVYQPRHDEESLPAHGCHFTEFGFWDTQSPIRKRGPDRVIIGLMGGSVARQLGTTTIGNLERELSQLRSFQGRSFEFVRLAIDGNKQPQHLMTLNYLLTLGGEFDLLINLDGLNEIALPGMDNVPFGVSAAYPRKWAALTAAASSLELTRMVGYVTHLRAERRDCARWYDAAPLRYSPTAALVWKARNARLDNQIMEQLEQISRRGQEESSYCSSGPPEAFESEEKLLAHCADIWTRSSILLHQLCDANQIRYFHFLQPNQYLAESKPIGREEAKVALNDRSPFARPVRLGYPLLRARVPQLLAAGVSFTDLTQIFADHPEPIYKDDCCHVTEAGDQLMAAAIAARIRAWYETH